MEQVTTIGLDIAKHVFQVHGADAAGDGFFASAHSHEASQFPSLAAQTRYVAPMGACPSARYWAREIGRLGHHVRLIAPAYVKPLLCLDCGRTTGSPKASTCPI
jgi:transposase